MSTKDNLEKEAHSASEKLHEASDSLKSGARQAADEAQRTANAYAEQGRAAAAGGISDFASAIRRASDELGQRDQDLAAIANTVSHTSVDDVMHSMKGVARRNPAVFVGGAVLAGLAVGRFLRASNERQPTRALPAQAPQQTAYRAPAAPTPPVGPANATK